MEALLAIIAGLSAIFAKAALLVTLFIGTTVSALAIRSAGRPTGSRSRRLWQLLCTASVLSALALISLRSSALPRVLSWELDKQLALRNYDVQLGDAELSLLAGKLSVQRLDLRGAEGVGLTIERVELDVDWSSILSEPIEFKELQIEGVVGRFAPLPNKLDPSNSSSDTSNFVAHRMLLSEVELVIAGQSEPLGHHLRVDWIETRPLRSDYLLYDLLVASQGLVRVDDRVVRIDRDGIWSATGVPLATLRARLGPPFSYLDSGTVDITLDPGRGAATLDEGTTLGLQLRLYDATFGEQKERSASEQAAARALDRALESGDSIALNVHLPIRAALLQNTLQLAGSKLESAASRALIDALIRSTRVRGHHR